MRLIYANMLSLHYHYDPIYACYKICQMIVIYNMLKLLKQVSGMHDVTRIMSIFKIVAGEK